MTDAGFISDGARPRQRWRIRRASWLASAGGSVNYVADWVMDALNDLHRSHRRRCDRRHLDRSAAAGGGGKVAGRGTGAEGRQVRRRAGCAGRHDAGRRGAGAGRRQELRGEPVQPRRHGEAPARLGVQAVRLSHRDRARPDARHGARRQADCDQRLAAGELRPRSISAGDADAGAGDVAQHRLGAADPGVRTDGGRRTAYRLGIASKLEPNASIALGTSEVSPLELVSAYAPFANGGLAIAPHVIERVRGRTARCSTRAPQRICSAASSIPPTSAMMNTMMRETLVTRHRAQGRAAGLAGGRQDRHQPGFPRRLVRRLHRPSRHRRLARQRRRLADQEGDGQRPAGRNLEPLHEGGASGRAGRVGLPGLGDAPPAAIASVLPHARQVFRGLRRRQTRDAHQRPTAVSTAG